MRGGGLHAVKPPGATQMQGGTHECRGDQRSQRGLGPRLNKTSGGDQVFPELNSTGAVREILSNFTASTDT